MLKKKIWAILVLCLILCGCDQIEKSKPQAEIAETVVSVSEVPDYSGQAYVAINNNEPIFTEEEMKADAFESYGELDDLGRCTVTFACIDESLMPTEDRGNIGQVKPTGWHTIKYEGIDGNYLYNRCHLIGFQLTGENANEENLITGTRYMNVEGMLPFENMVADYIVETGNSVLYRVTPIYEGENLLANGVQMEAYSVEDDGDGICFNVFVYNVQPGIGISYETGESWKEEHVVEEETPIIHSEVNYILNTNTKKFHLPSCRYAEDISEWNREEYGGDREALIEEGFEPCKGCNP